MNKKVSILIPMYNAEAFVRETLDSCLKQTYQNIEVIVVDDGSNDRSFAVAKEYESDSRVKVFSIQNSGACVARNVALKQATGGYIVFLDADNIISPEKIQSQIEILENSDCKEIVATGPWDRFYNSITEAKFPQLHIYKSYRHGIDLLLDLWNYSEMFETGCYMISRELAIKAGPWMPGLNKNQDGEYFSRVLMQSADVIFCPEAKVYYRTGEYDSVSKDNSRTKVEALLYSFKCYKYNILKYEDTPRVKAALTRNFSLFMYLYYGQYPDLCKQAKEEIIEMGLKPFQAGTFRSKLFSKLIGLENFLKLRRFFLKR